MRIKIGKFLFHELPLFLSWGTAILFIALKLNKHFLEHISYPYLFSGLFFWLFLIILLNAFKVAHQVESLSTKLGEPFSTLILTLTVISIEVVTIASVMLTGEHNPTLARDTMYAIVMIILNGIIGLSLVVGGIRYREQRYNLRGSLTFLSVILVLSVIGLVLPNFTLSTAQSNFSITQTVFLIITSLMIYGIFLAIQTVSHRSQFVVSSQSNLASIPFNKYHQETSQFNIILLIAYLIPTLILAKLIATPIESILNILHTPPALGGLLVAILVLSPEAVSAIRFSLANRLQHSVNIALGSVLATTALTIPIILTIGLLVGKKIILGLEMKNVVLLLLTLVTSIITFASGRTNVLQGALHLLLFLSYILMIFD